MFSRRTAFAGADSRAILAPMLIGLWIRDVVLIEALDLSIGPGLTVLTGETGAGKSIILDALGLATGARADAGLVRRGAGRGVRRLRARARPSGLGAAGGQGPLLRPRRGPGAAPHAQRRWPLQSLRQRPGDRRG